MSAHIPHIPSLLDASRVAKTLLTIAKLARDHHLSNCSFLLKPTLLVVIIDFKNSFLKTLHRLRSVFNLWHHFHLMLLLQNFCLSCYRLGSFLIIFQPLFVMLYMSSGLFFGTPSPRSIRVEPGGIISIDE